MVQQYRYVMTFVSVLTHSLILRRRAAGYLPSLFNKLESLINPDALFKIDLASIKFIVNPEEFVILALLRGNQ